MSSTVNKASRSTSNPSYVNVSEPQLSNNPPIHEAPRTVIDYRMLARDRHSLSPFPATHILSWYGGIKAPATDGLPRGSRPRVLDISDLFKNFNLDAEQKEKLEAIQKMLLPLGDNLVIWYCNLKEIINFLIPEVKQDFLQSFLDKCQDQESTCKVISLIDKGFRNLVYVDQQKDLFLLLRRYSLCDWPKAVKILQKKDIQIVSVFHKQIIELFADEFSLNGGSDIYKKISSVLNIFLRITDAERFLGELRDVFLILAPEVKQDFLDCFLRCERDKEPAFAVVSLVKQGLAEIYNIQQQKDLFAGFVSCPIAEWPIVVAKFREVNTPHNQERDWIWFLLCQLQVSEEQSRDILAVLPVRNYGEFLELLATVQRCLAPKLESDFLDVIMRFSRDEADIDEVISSIILGLNSLKKEQQKAMFSLFLDNPIDEWSDIVDFLGMNYDDRLSYVLNIFNALNPTKEQSVKMLDMLQEISCSETAEGKELGEFYLTLKNLVNSLSSAVSGRLLERFSDYCTDGEATNSFFSCVNEFLTLLRGEGQQEKLLLILERCPFNDWQILGDLLDDSENKAKVLSCMDQKTPQQKLIITKKFQHLCSTPGLTLAPKQLSRLADILATCLAPRDYLSFYLNVESVLMHLDAQLVQEFLTRLISHVSGKVRLIEVISAMAQGLANCVADEEQSQLTQQREFLQNFAKHDLGADEADGDFALEPVASSSREASSAPTGINEDHLEEGFSAPVPTELHQVPSPSSAV